MNKSNLDFLIRRGVGLSALVALQIGGVACGDGSQRDAVERASTYGTDTSHAAEEPVEALPSPSLETELASVHQPSLPSMPEPVVEVAPDPDPYAPSIDENAPVGVRRIVVATGIEDREPIDAADEFVLGENDRTYVFVEARNQTDEKGTLGVTFEPANGEVTGHVTLNIPASATRWRTWAYTRHIYTPGQWRVVIRDELGSVVAERRFEVVE